MMTKSGHVSKMDKEEVGDAKPVPPRHAVRTPFSIRDQNTISVLDNLRQNLLDRIGRLVAARTDKHGVDRTIRPVEGRWRVDCLDHIRSFEVDGRSWGDDASHRWRSEGVIWLWTVVDNLVPVRQFSM